MTIHFYNQHLTVLGVKTPIPILHTVAPQGLW